MDKGGFCKCTRKVGLKAAGAISPSFRKHTHHAKWLKIVKVKCLFCVFMGFVSFAMMMMVICVNINFHSLDRLGPACNCNISNHSSRVYAFNWIFFPSSWFFDAVAVFCARITSQKCTSNACHCCNRSWPMFKSRPLCFLSALLDIHTPFMGWSSTLMQSKQNDTHNAKLCDYVGVFIHVPMFDASSICYLEVVVQLQHNSAWGKNTLCSHKMQSANRFINSMAHLDAGLLLRSSSFLSYRHHRHSHTF